MVTRVLRFLSACVIPFGDTHFRARTAGITLAVLTLFLFETAHASDAVSRGAEAFRECRACHAIEPGKHRSGPSVFGTFGAVLGSAEGYRYSRAFRRKRDEGVIWDEAGLDIFLTKPRDFVRGTKMRFKGIEDPTRRADIIAYLKTLGP